jgi:hypothetical protein
MPGPCGYFNILYNSGRNIQIEGKGTAIVAETAEGGGGGERGIEDASKIALAS